MAKSSGESTIVKSPLHKFSVEEIRAEIARRERMMNRLANQKNRILDRLNEIDSVIMSMGGKSPKKISQPKVKNDQTLAEALQSVMKKGKPMLLSEIEEKILAHGYKTNAENFRLIINQNVLKHPKIFKRVAKATYMLIK